MLKNILLLLVACACLPNCKAQVGDNNIKVNLTQLLVKEMEINLSYERVIDPGVTFEIRPSYFLDNMTMVNSEDAYEHSGYGLDAEMRVFFQHDPEAPVGMYMSPFFKSSLFKETEEVDDGSEADIDKLVYLQYGLAIGMQKLVAKRIILDMNAGSQRNVMYGKELEAKDYYDSLSDELFTPRVSFSVGYNF